MNEIEVKATRSFSHLLGNFTRGRTYMLDVDYPAVKGLVDGGYLVPVTEPEVPRASIDLAELDEFLSSGVGTRRTRPKKGEAGEEVIIPLTKPARAAKLIRESGVDDGAAEVEPGTD